MLLQDYFQKHQFVRDLGGFVVQTDLQSNCCAYLCFVGASIVEQHQYYQPPNPKTQNQY